MKNPPVRKLCMLTGTMFLMLMPQTALAVDFPETEAALSDFGEIIDRARADEALQEFRLQTFSAWNSRMSSLAAQTVQVSRLVMPLLAEETELFWADAAKAIRQGVAESIFLAGLPDQAILHQDLMMLRRRYGQDVTYAFRFASPEPKTLHTLADYYCLPGMDVPVPSKNMTFLQSRLERMLSSYSGTWSVYVKNLEDGSSMIINDIAMPSASLMKLFVMGTVYEAISNGTLERTQEIMARMSAMISYSSNEDTNTLLKLLGDGSYEDGIAKVNEYIVSHRYSDKTHEYNGFQDTSAIVSPNHTNQVRAADCGALLERVYHRTFASRKICNEVEDWMLHQDTRYKIPAGIGSDVPVGNKTGETDSIENDVAIVYSDACDYIICVLSHDWDNKDEAQKHIQQISGEVYAYFTDEDYVSSRFHPVSLADE